VQQDQARGGGKMAGMGPLRLGQRRIQQALDMRGERRLVGEVHASSLGISA
jgi:hypothetical protein